MSIYTIIGSILLTCGCGMLAYMLGSYFTPSKRDKDWVCKGYERWCEITDDSELPIPEDFSSNITEEE